VLGNYGIVPDVAGNGVEAIKAVRRLSYDVVFMDIHMPELDGLEATRAIRAMQGPAARVPIVALTANAFVEDVQRCKDAGMNGHVGKPFRKEELITALAEALRGGNRPARSRAIERRQAGVAPVVDWRVIEAFRADSGDEMLRVLLDAYLSDTATKLQTLADFARSGTISSEGVRIAHSLKSASAMAGAAALSAYATNVEAKLSASERATESDAQMMLELFEGYRAALKGRGLIAA
jgi:CheY-like chemotaxis protein/HPt (histidine-containing phosphotransfer) domain-containing protein